MKGSISYVMVTLKDGSKVRVTRAAYDAYLTATKAKKAKPTLKWTL